MRLSSLATAGVREIRRLEFRYFDPLRFTARKGRLQRLGIAGVAELPVAELDLHRESPHCDDNCAVFLRNEESYLAKYLGIGGAAPWRGTPCLIDLDAYPDFDAYLARVRRHSKGGVLRQVRQARGKGFRCRIIARELYHRQIFEIRASKRFRSGPVLEAFLTTPPPDFADGITVEQLAAHLGQELPLFMRHAALPDPPTPRCPYHWRTDWGVLITEDVVGAGGVVFPERLVGFVFLRRIGNLVRTSAAMGHGAYLSLHTIKLLFHDIVQWLLARRDPLVAGLRYFQYGAAEHGSDGLLAWKQSFEFAPYRFRLAASANGYAD